MSLKDIYQQEMINIQVKTEIISGGDKYLGGL